MDRYDQWYGYTPPIKIDGIKAKNQSGDAAQNWWGKRFIGLLESFGIGERLKRGRSYAKKGQVANMEFAPGAITAEVQGSRRAPYKVSIKMHIFSEKDWLNAERRIASNALFLAKLLSGEMPENIDEAFEACNISLLPKSTSDLVTNCTCPDWSNPCKHVAAVLYLVGERLDEDPLLIFRFRGKTKAELLSSLSFQDGSIKFSAEKAAHMPTWRSVVAQGHKPRRVRAQNFWSSEVDFDIRSRLNEPDKNANSSLSFLNSAESMAFKINGLDFKEQLLAAYEAFPHLTENMKIEPDE